MGSYTLRDLQAWRKSLNEHCGTEDDNADEAWGKFCEEYLELHVAYCYKKGKTADELADCLICLLRLANVLGIDLEQAVVEKLKVIGERDQKARDKERGR